MTHKNERQGRAIVQNIPFASVLMSSQTIHFYIHIIQHQDYSGTCDKAHGWYIIIAVDKKSIILWWTMASLFKCNHQQRQRRLSARCWVLSLEIRSIWNRWICFPVSAIWLGNPIYWFFWAANREVLLQRNVQCWMKERPNAAIVPLECEYDDESSCGQTGGQNSGWYGWQATEMYTHYGFKSFNSRQFKSNIF